MNSKQIKDAKVKQERIECLEENKGRSLTLVLTMLFLFSQKITGNKKKEKKNGTTSNKDSA